jgi:hypothetical protein
MPAAIPISTSRRLRGNLPPGVGSLATNAGYQRDRSGIASAGIVAARITFSEYRLSLGIRNRYTFPCADCALTTKVKER